MSFFSFLLNDVYPSSVEMPTGKKIMGGENNQQYFASFFNIWAKINGVAFAIWWDKFHFWSATINGYSLFRRDRGGKKDVRAVLCNKSWIECKELSLKKSHEREKSLWVEIRDYGNKENLIADV